MQQDADIAESQLRDYQARIGLAFEHERYMAELGALRDQLKVALSGQVKEGEPDSAELAERIKALRAGNVVEASSGERSVKKLSAGAGDSEDSAERGGGCCGGWMAEGD